MAKFLYKEHAAGKAKGDWQEIDAKNPDDVALKVVGLSLSKVGKLGNLRLRVRRSGDPEEIAFYEKNSN